MRKNLEINDLTMETLKEIRRNREFDRLCYERLRDYSPIAFKVLMVALNEEIDVTRLCKQMHAKGVPGNTLVIFVGAMNHIKTLN